MKLSLSSQFFTKWTNSTLSTCLMQHGSQSQLSQENNQPCLFYLPFVYGHNLKKCKYCILIAISALIANSRSLMNIKDFLLFLFSWTIVVPINSVGRWVLLKSPSFVGTNNNDKTNVNLLMFAVHRFSRTGDAFALYF